MLQIWDGKESIVLLLSNVFGRPKITNPTWLACWVETMQLSFNVHYGVHGSETVLGKVVFALHMVRQENSKNDPWRIQSQSEHSSVVPE